MILFITVTVGLIFFTAQILYYELKKEINKIKLELEPLFKEGGVYPKTQQLPFEVTKLHRKVWVKPAPLYLVISK
jgi:hypothetical protein